MVIPLILFNVFGILTRGLIEIKILTNISDLYLLKYYIFIFTVINKIFLKNSEYFSVILKQLYYIDMMCNFYRNRHVLRTLECFRR